MEDDLPSLGPPPELLCLAPGKRQSPAVYAEEVKPKIRRLDHDDDKGMGEPWSAPILRRVCP